MHAKPSPKDIEAEALRLGATPAAVFKWRTRGIPSNWQLKLIRESRGKFTPDDFSPQGKDAKVQEAAQ